MSDSERVIHMVRGRDLVENREAQKAFIEAMTGEPLVDESILDMTLDEIEERIAKRAAERATEEIKGQKQ